MIFTLEALKAKHGDSLLLHFGNQSLPRHIVIDGGPSGVYSRFLKPRLKSLLNNRAAAGGGDTLPIDLAMVSHIDDDHINGILRWFSDIDQGSGVLCAVSGLWHNSFDDIIGSPKEADALRTSLASTVTASLSPAGSSSGLHVHAGMILASVPQGRNLRNLAKKIGLTINGGFSGGLIVVKPNQKREKRKFGPLTLSILGPRLDRILALQEEWKTKIKKLGLAQKAAFTDESVFNLSSVIVLVEADSKSILLTGDARGDDILTGLNQAKLFKNGVFKTDVLKIPHHGSDHNVSTEFFRRVVADHYVFSGDGEHDNPELATLDMLFEARPEGGYTLNFTYDEPRIKSHLAKRGVVGKGIKVRFPDAGAVGLKIDLDQPMTL
jgi:hypothetical protein